MLELYLQFSQLPYEINDPWSLKSEFSDGAKLQTRIMKWRKNEKPSRLLITPFFNTLEVTQVNGYHPVFWLVI
jgi:hypothetical protein